MKQVLLAARIAGCICLSLNPDLPMHGQAPPPAPPTDYEAAVTIRASGTFDVKLTPQPGDTSVGRMLIDKQFHGDLSGTSKGEMLAFMTTVKGSAGYVAIEQVSGTLHGHRGTFVFQHSGTMNRGVGQLTITVVPDSGTDELVGLTGTMMINIADGKHSYDFDYELPKAN